MTEQSLCVLGTVRPLDGKQELLYIIRWLAQANQRIITCLSEQQI